MTTFKFPDWTILSKGGHIQEGAPIADADLQNGARIVETARKDSKEAKATGYAYSMVYRIIDGEQVSDNFVLPYPSKGANGGSWKDSDWVDQWQSRKSGIVTPTESNDSTGKLTWQDIKEMHEAGLMTKAEVKKWVKANT